MIFPNRVRNSRKPGPRRKSRMSSTNNPPRPGRYGADQMELMTTFKGNFYELISLPSKSNIVMMRPIRRAVNQTCQTFGQLLEAVSQSHSQLTQPSQTLP